MADNDAFPWNDGRRTEYYTAVGYLCDKWNVVDRLYCWRASDIMGIKRSKHHILFRHLGTVAIGEFMNEYAEAHIKSKATREQVAYVIKYVNACRVNRNAIVHGWADLHGVKGLDSIRVRPKPDQRRAKPKDFVIKLEDIARVCDEMEMAGRLTVAMSFLFDRRGIKTMKGLLGAEWRSRLHAKPPPPRFVGASPQTHPKPKARRRSSRG